MKNRSVTNLKAEHTQEISKIQIKHDNEITILKNNLKNVTLLTKSKENKNQEHLEVLDKIHNLQEEMVKMKDYYFLR